MKERNLASVLGGGLAAMVVVGLAVFLASLAGPRPAPSAVGTLPFERPGHPAVIPGFSPPRPLSETRASSGGGTGAIAGAIGSAPSARGGVTRIPPKGFGGFLRGLPRTLVAFGPGGLAPAVDAAFDALRSLDAGVGGGHRDVTVASESGSKVAGHTKGARSHHGALHARGHTSGQAPVKAQVKARAASGARTARISVWLRAATRWVAHLRAHHSRWG